MGNTSRGSHCVLESLLTCSYERKLMEKELKLLILNSLDKGTRIKMIVQNKVWGLSVDKMASGDCMGSGNFL